MKQGRFHHGNLRAELIALATAELAEKPAEALSMRDLAARLGVSPGAPYRHFASKDDLLHAVAEAGLRNIVEGYRAAERLDVSPMERLRVVCRDYLDLAEDNPGLFHLLFFTPAYKEGGAGDGKAAEPGSAFTVFERLVAATLGSSDAAVARRKALASWSLLHGFAVLRMQGRIAPFATVKEVEDTVLDLVCTLG